MGRKSFFLLKYLFLYFTRNTFCQDDYEEPECYDDLTLGTFITAPYKVTLLINADISGALFTLRIQYEYTQIQCKEGARYVTVVCKDILKTTYEFETADWCTTTSESCSASKEKQLFCPATCNLCSSSDALFAKAENDSRTMGKQESKWMACSNKEQMRLGCFHGCRKNRLGIYFKMT